MARLSYLVSSIGKSCSAAAYICPNCGERRSVVVDRKFLVTTLRRCAGCLLMFRAPAELPSKNERFYNGRYRQGYTTDLPDDESLAVFVAHNFAGTERDYSRYIDILRQLTGGTDKILVDFGCSWGYGSYQLAQAGYNVRSYEISAQRARFAHEKLGVHLIDDFYAWAESPTAAGTIDVFFSAHVLEHVPAPRSVVDVALRVLKPDGLFVAAHPNGSAACRADKPDWHKLWGEVHPNMLDDVYYNDAFATCPRLFGSLPVKPTAAQRNLLMATTEPIAIYIDRLHRDEMLFVARKLPADDS